MNEVKTDYVKNLLAFRDCIASQCFTKIAEGDWIGVARIAAAINVINDLLKMPAVKAWELPF